MFKLDEECVWQGGDSIKFQNVVIPIVMTYTPNSWKS